jgi:prolyl-tRNA synthetase
MGSYGIGVERLIAAMAEASCDEKGLLWNKAVAPFEVVVLELGDTQGKAEEIYKMLLSRGVSILYDDRNERAGVKFAEAEMIGVPLQVVVSARNLEAVEVKLRKTGEAREESPDTLYREFGVY